MRKGKRAQVDEQQQQNFTIATTSSNLTDSKSTTSQQVPLSVTTLKKPMPENLRANAEKEVIKE